MSELDLDLKLLARRLAWTQGAATRIDVPLRTLVDRKRAGAGFQEFTDLDVLAFSSAPNTQVHLEIFDCKTSAARSTERMFWLAGLVELFEPDQAWMVREKNITEAARALAARLHLGTMSRSDLAAMGRIHDSRNGEATSHTAIRRLFDRDAVEQYQRKMAGLDRKLRPLQEALRYDAWMVEPHRNLSMLPGVLADADALASDNPVHIAMICDLAWLYLYALAHGAAYVARTGAVDLEARFEEFFLGGQTGKRDKEAVRDVFVRVTGHDDAALLPQYYPNLLELFGRFFIAPQRIIAGMRYVEVLAAGVVAKRRPNLAEAFGSAYDPVAAKLTGDVLALLVGAAGLPPSFRATFRSLLLGPPPERTAPAAPEPAPPATASTAATTAASSPVADPADPANPANPADPADPADPAPSQDATAPRQQDGDGTRHLADPVGPADPVVVVDGATQTVAGSPATTEQTSPAAAKAGRDSAAEHEGDATAEAHTDDPEADDDAKTVQDQPKRPATSGVAEPGGTADTLDLDSIDKPSPPGPSRPRPPRRP